MRYAYDSHEIKAQEDVVVVATRWGKDGWRWVNIDSVPWNTMTMIFELEQAEENA
jgi:hypothetical protein